MDSSLSDVPLGSYSLLIEIVSFAVLLCLSMLFSASETAFVSLTSSDINELKSKNSKLDRLTEQIAKKTDFIHVTLLIRNKYINVSIATLAALLTRHIFFGTAFETSAMIIDVFVVGFVLLFLG